MRIPQLSRKANLPKRHKHRVVSTLVLRRLYDQLASKSIKRWLQCDFLNSVRTGTDFAYMHTLPTKRVNEGQQLAYWCLRVPRAAYCSSSKRY